MGHKVNPIGLRLGINRTWDSRWYAGNDYAKLLHGDLKLREKLRERLKGAGVSRVVIERPAKKPRVTIHAARPGVVIGKKGADIEVLRKDLAKMAGAEVSLNIMEIRKPEIDSTLVAVHNDAFFRPAEIQPASQFADHQDIHALELFRLERR